MSGKVLIGCGALVMIGLVVAFLMGVVGFNQLVTAEQRVEAAWGQVENVYQRRADLVPNLVATVQGARDFERETLESVVRARSQVGQIQIDNPPSAEQLEAFQQAQGSLSSALSRLLVVVERYPELRATDNFRDLQSQLEGTENRIAVERRSFNEAARQYNTLRSRFPTRLFAGFLGFDDKPYFSATEGADKPPEVKF